MTLAGFAGTHSDLIGLLAVGCLAYFLLNGFGRRFLSPILDSQKRCESLLTEIRDALRQPR